MVTYQNLLPGKLIKRYKRFLADIELEDGSIVTAHCPNSGRMTSCLGGGWPVMLSESANPARKYKYTWEMVHNGKCWIGINTHMANSIVQNAIKDRLISELTGYRRLEREVQYGNNSRIDILLSNETEKCFVEVKNVTLFDEGYYQFPDAVTARGRKHLQELQGMAERGYRAVMLFLIQRSDADKFKIAEHIDPLYHKEFIKAVENGMEYLAYQADVSPEKIQVQKKLKNEFFFY
jgi:sugar fermentation stimulation protein A